MILRDLFYTAATIDVVRKLDICHDDCTRCLHLCKSDGLTYCDAVDIISYKNPFRDKDDFVEYHLDGECEPLKIDFENE